MQLDSSFSTLTPLIMSLQRLGPGHGKSARHRQQTHQQVLVVLRQGDFAARMVHAHGQRLMASVYGRGRRDESDAGGSGRDPPSLEARREKLEALHGHVKWCMAHLLRLCDAAAKVAMRASLWAALPAGTPGQGASHHDELCELLECAGATSALIICTAGEWRVLRECSCLHAR